MDGKIITPEIKALWTPSTYAWKEMPKGQEAYVAAETGRLIAIVTEPTADTPYSEVLQMPHRLSAGAYLSVQEAETACEKFTYAAAATQIPSAGKGH